MLLFIFTVVVYIFFVYGVIEFFRKLYWDILNKKGIFTEKKINVLIDGINDIEYTVRLLKKDFHYICLIDKEYREEIENIVENLSHDMYVEYMTLEEIRKKDSS